MDNKVLSAICCITLQALTIVTWEEFKSAANMEEGMISGKDILSTFRW